MKKFKQWWDETSDNVADEKIAFDAETIRRDLQSGSEDAEYVLSLVGSAMTEGVRQFIQSLVPDRRVTCVLRID